MWKLEKHGGTLGKTSRTVGLEVGVADSARPGAAVAEDAEAEAHGSVEETCIDHTGAGLEQPEPAVEVGAVAATVCTVVYSSEAAELAEVVAAAGNTEAD